MTETLLLDAYRLGALLGVGLGLVLALVVNELRGSWREWRRDMERSRRVRCMRDWR